MKTFTEFLTDKSVAGGIFEEEALKNKSVLGFLNPFIIGSNTEQHPEATGDADDPKIWHIHYLRLPVSELIKAIPAIQKAMYEGWYSLLWDDLTIKVIFSNGLATITNTGSTNSPAFNGGEINKITGLAQQNGLDSTYMAKYLGQGLSAYRLMGQK